MSMKKIIISIGICFFLFHAQTFASAALSLKTPNAISVGKKIAVTVLLETEGNSVNSASVSLKLSNQNIKLVGYQEYQSLIKFWIQQPKQEGNTVTFIGGIPGGVATVTEGTNVKTQIPLVVLLFEAIDDGSTTLTIEDSTILQNDGLGTALLHERKSAQIAIVKSFIQGQDSMDPLLPETPDENPPIFEDVTYVPSSILSKTPPLVSFTAVDQESGIARYEAVIGGKITENVQSPLSLSRKFFSYTVVLNAYDIYGNKQVATVSVPGVITGGSVTLFFFIILIIIGSVRIVMKRKYEKK